MQIFGGVRHFLALNADAAVDANRRPRQRRRFPPEMARIVMRGRDAPQRSEVRKSSIAVQGAPLKSNNRIDFQLWFT